MTSFILLPGAGGTSWYWSRVIPLLEAAGHEAVAVDLPGDDPAAGLPEYVELTLEAIGERRDVVLVAQSLGGFTAAAAWEKAGVAEIVLVNAMIPEPGETAGAWWGNVGWEEARSRAARDGGEYPEEFSLEEYFLHDVAPEVAAEGEPFQRPEAEAVFGSVCSFSGWPEGRTRVISGADDRFFPVEFQRRVALERVGVEPVAVPGGHLVALARPEELVRALLG
ncbi:MULTISPECIES: alpha/beta hydrolase [Arthrobacter]|uniref:Alpha/beta hydrolase n=2 Tax=Arthrobacter TaxID=1663 RepID=A0ABU9KJT0_9MICC|nr:alpha/beta hydrolase [Arthrobacter sp. YJM1]MDP5226710.1 alpha/beta hydrolase [Arthrobacter sp. YJM1]